MRTPREWTAGIPQSGIQILRVDGKTVGIMREDKDVAFIVAACNIMEQRLSLIGRAIPFDEGPE